MSAIPAFPEQSHYEVCIENGKALCRQLASFERTDVTKCPALESLYHLETGYLRVRDQTFEKQLHELNVSSSFTYVDVKNTPGQMDIPYSNWYNPKAIMARENFRARDTYSNSQRLYASEVLWQSFLSAHGDPHKLSTIIRHSVINASSRTAIWHAARKSSCTDDGTKGYKVYTKWNDGFYAILGSQNGANSMRILLDHKAKIGYRTVEKVVVLPCHDEDDEELARTFVLILSDRRQRPSMIPRPKKK
jgi:hypothetical protein